METTHITSAPKISWGRMLVDGVKIVAAVTAVVAVGGFLIFAAPSFLDGLWNEQIMGRGLEAGTQPLAPNAGAWIEESATHLWDGITTTLQTAYEHVSTFLSEVTNANTEHEFAKNVQDAAKNPYVQVATAGSAVALTAYGIGSWRTRVKEERQANTEQKPVAKAPFPMELLPHNKKPMQSYTDTRKKFANTLINETASHGVTSR